MGVKRIRLGIILMIMKTNLIFMNVKNQSTITSCANISIRVGTTQTLTLHTWMGTISVSNGVNFPPRIILLFNEAMTGMVLIPIFGVSHILHLILVIHPKRNGYGVLVTPKPGEEVSWMAPVPTVLVAVLIYS